jgi:hypothetical protein
MFFMALFHANKGVIMKYIFYGFIAGMVLFNMNLKAESVWTDDGSLIIIDGSDDVSVYIDDEGSVNYEAGISNDESTFIYGADKLTVCQPTANGSICY